ncbi:MAG TPA: class I SAM-dependent methyltransferase [Candidatus Paceibacterota bacterium]|jgi:SAM-dependent methyltransferase
MVIAPKPYWDEAHERYAHTDWIHKPTLFAESVLEYFPAEGKVLDAGCGQGQDSRFFAGRGYHVTGMDFAPAGIQKAIEKTPPVLASRLSFIEADLASRLPFQDGEFDVVHSHLAAHYFTEVETRTLIGEFARVLKEGGVLTLLLNSVHDAEFGKGTFIEDGYFLVDGVKKRYFSAQSLSAYVGDFNPIILDELGETYKDRALGNSNLVRFVGKKK